MKLQKKLMIIFILISIIPFLAGAGIILFTSDKAVRKNARGFLSEYTDAIAMDIQAFFVRKTGLIESISFFPGMADMTWPEVQEALSPLFKSFSQADQINSYLLVNRDGTFYSSDDTGNPARGGLMTMNDENPHAVPLVLSDRDYFQFLIQNNPHKEHRTYVSNPVINRATGQKNIIIGSNLINDAGDIRGIIGFYVERGTLENTLDTVTTKSRENFGERLVLLLLSENNTILSHREYDPRQNKYTERALNVEGGFTDDYLSLSFQHAYMDLHAGDSTFYQDEATGERYYMVASPVAGTGYRVVFALPEQVLYATVFTIEKIIVIVLALTLIAVFIFSFLLSFSITKPIVTVSATLKDISDGEGDLTKTVVSNSKDEIGDLARYFNSTLGKIKNLVIVIKNQAQALSGVGSELAGNMTETSAAINEITANIQGIKNQIINQSSSITETNATMEQITLNIDKLSNQVENQGRNVSQSTAAVEEMIANIRSVTESLIKNSIHVNDLINATQSGRTRMQAMAADIQQIARDSEGILAVNTVMEDIAGQTNLLSINAAIEAAHARDAGKGFAVVAEEIRKLAENSGMQSKVISVELKKIKDSIDKMTASAGDVLSEFEAIDNNVLIVSDQDEHIRKAMEEQNAGSQQILEAIQALNQTTRLVKDSSGEMLEGSRQVILESRNLDMTTREISNGMSEMAAGAEQINVAVNRVNVISGENRNNIDVLVREMAKFKVE